MFLKGFSSQWPDLIHDTPKAPHITGVGVGLVMKGLVREWDHYENGMGYKTLKGAQTSGAVHLTGIFPPFDR